MKNHHLGEYVWVTFSKHPTRSKSKFKESLGILAHLLRMVMEPKYYAFRFGDWTALAHHLTFGDWMPRVSKWVVFTYL